MTNFRIMRITRELRDNEREQRGTSEQGGKRVNPACWYIRTLKHESRKRNLTPRSDRKIENHPYVEFAEGISSKQILRLTMVGSYLLG